MYALTLAADAVPRQELLSGVLVIFRCSELKPRCNHKQQTWFRTSFQTVDYLLHSKPEP